MCFHGQGVPQDLAKAKKWYRKAAEQGQEDAQNNLGIMYYKGQGVPRDYIQAHMWFDLAVANGNEMARDGLDLVTKEMTPAHIAEAQRLAREWKAKS